MLYIPFHLIDLSHNAISFYNLIDDGGVPGIKIPQTNGGVPGLNIPKNKPAFVKGLKWAQG